MNAPSVLLALSSRSCYIWQSSCNGFLSPNSLALKSCCNLLCSDAAVRLMSCSLSMVYGVSLRGFRIKSWTLVANSGASEVTMWSNLVFWAVIPQVVNWASTWANQIWGSVGQKGEVWGVLLLFCQHQAVLPAQVHDHSSLRLQFYSDHVRVTKLSCKANS